MRAQAIAEAKTWLATPYRHQASIKGIGCDCIGLIVGVAEALHLPEAAQWQTDPDYRGYGTTPLPDKLRAAAAKYLDPILTGEPGDIALFTFLREPMHFGILTALDYFVHAYQPVGRVVENRLDAKWQRRIVGFYSYRWPH